jgi:hypothetical protein
MEWSDSSFAAMTDARRTLVATDTSVRISESLDEWMMIGRLGVFRHRSRMPAGNVGVLTVVLLVGGATDSSEPVAACKEQPSWSAPDAGAALK